MILKWILMNNAVSCVIPGASRKEQVFSNIEVESMKNLTNEELEIIKNIYEMNIKPLVHQLW